MSSPVSSAEILCEWGQGAEEQVRIPVIWREPFPIVGQIHPRHQPARRTMETTTTPAQPDNSSLEMMSALENDAFPNYNLQEDDTTIDNDLLPHQQQLGTPHSSRSRASSSSGIDDIDFEIDPDSVDFEPLLVSGTGRILQYHNSSFYDYEEGGNNEEDVSVSSSVMTPVTTNVNKNGSDFEAVREVVADIYNLGRKRRRRPWGDWMQSAVQECFDKLSSVSSSSSSDIFNIRSYSFSQLARVASVVFASIFILSGGMYLMEFGKSNSYQLETTNTKTTNSNAFIRGVDTQMESNKGITETTTIDPVLEQHMMNTDTAILKARTSNMAIWVPFIGSSPTSTNQLLENIVASFISACLSRTVFDFQMDAKMQPGSIMPVIHSAQQPLQPRSVGADKSLPMAIFTPFFTEAATTIFDSAHSGIFFTILHDPLHIYAEEYLQSTSEKNGAEDVMNYDNLLVRSLAGFQDTNRKVNDWDLEVAKEMLKRKFFLGSCDHPSETLRRLGYFHGQRDTRSLDNDPRNEVCNQTRQSWEQECDHMKKTWEAKMKRMDPQIILRIKEKHQYDVLLFEYASSYFDMQSALFS